MTDKRALPSGWRWVRFGDVVHQVKETTRDPESEGLNRIVGLEHLDSESLPLKRWSEFSELPDGTSFTRTFRSGHVLFGKRRAYQRKVAVPDFGGVCSGDILVFEPSSQALLAEFLPYVVQSDGFFNHALGTSAGSLSPRTKWQELAKYEFALPTPAEQRSLIEVLSAVDQFCASLTDVAEHALALAGALVADVAASAGSETVRNLADCCRLPISYGIVQPGLSVPDGVPYVNVEDMTAGPLRRAALPTTTSEISAKHRRTLLDPGDVVVALRGPIGLAVEISPELAGANLSRGVARLAPGPDVRSAYLAACLSTPYVISQIVRVSTGSTFKELKIGALRGIRIPVPDVDVQERVAQTVEAAGAVASAANHEAARARSMRRALLNGVSDSHEL